VRRERKPERVVHGRQERPRSSATDDVKPITPAAFLAALREERAKIDAAIAAVEALA
jgi:hypothetical protein